jgi:hypothetical protein
MRQAMPITPGMIGGRAEITGSPILSETLQAAELSYAIRTSSASRPGVGAATCSST